MTKVLKRPVCPRGSKKGRRRNAGSKAKFNKFADLGMFEVSQQDRRSKGVAIDGLRKCLGRTEGKRLEKKKVFDWMLLYWTCLFLLICAVFLKVDFLFGVFFAPSVF